MPNRTMLKKKKGMLFWYIVPLGLILIVGLAIFIVPDPAVNYIGEKPLKIIKTSLDFEKLLYYIDQSAKLSGYKSIYELSSNGGFDENVKCGKFIDYALWNNKDKKIEECFPDYESNFKTIFDNYLKEYLEKNPNYEIFVDYHYILANNGNFKIIGISEEETSVSTNALVKKFLPEMISLDYEIPKEKEKTLNTIQEKYGNEIRLAIQSLPPDAPKPSEALIEAIIMVESSGNEKAISATGCRGLAQACYKTAKDYINIFEKLTSCDCTGKTCVTSPKCNDNNDGRGDAKKSVRFMTKYISDLMRSFKDYDSQEEFAVLSYNGGSTVIKNAIKRTGEKNPTWTEVYLEITPDLITYFKTLSEKENKVKEIKSYLVKVMSYKKAYDGAEKKVTGAAVVTTKINSPISTFIGAYSSKPNFKVELDFDFAIFEKLKEQSKELIDKCSKESNIEDCITGNIMIFNFNSKIEWVKVEGSNADKTFKFDVNTHKTLFPFEKEVIIKFALYFPEPTQ